MPTRTIITKVNVSDIKKVGGNDQLELNYDQIFGADVGNKIEVSMTPLSDTEIAVSLTANVSNDTTPS